MTDEEVARFAVQLREAERVRMRIAKDEGSGVNDSLDMMQQLGVVPEPGQEGVEPSH